MNVTKLILILVIACTSKGQQEFDCKPKDGCQFATCDQSLPSALKRNEYSITCLPKMNKRQSSGDLTSLHLDNSDEIAELKKTFDSHHKVIESMREKLRDLTLQNAKLVAETGALKKCRCDPAHYKKDILPTVAGRCVFRVKDDCYFVVTKDEKIDFRQAWDSCDEYQSNVATIDNLLTYNAILTYMERITSGRAWTAWFGNTYNPLNGQYYPTGYIKWKYRSYEKQNTNMLISWRHEFDNGLNNVDPSARESDRVVCKLYQQLPY